MVYNRDINEIWINKMSKNIAFDDVVEENVISISKSNENLVINSLEQYAEKRFGESTQKCEAFKKRLLDKAFLSKATHALMQVSYFLYGACYAKDSEYEKSVKKLTAEIKDDISVIAEMKVFLIKHHENISDVSLLNDLGVSKYFKRIDKVLLSLQMYVDKL